MSESVNRPQVGNGQIVGTYFMTASERTSKTWWLHGSSISYGYVAAVVSFPTGRVQLASSLDTNETFD
jgi:hypothetical protein